jgi:hypothetical protein
MGLRNRESDVLSACLQWLTLMRVWHWRQNQGAIPLRNGGFRRFVGLRGLPDILAVLPRECEVVGQGRCKFAVLVGIEVKRPGEKPRPEQRAFLEQLEGMGGVGLCVHSVAELEEKLRPYLSGRPPARLLDGPGAAA